MPSPPGPSEEFVVTIAISGPKDLNAVRDFKDECNNLVKKYNGKIIDVRLQRKESS
jgi:hypothetical protein